MKADSTVRSDALAISQLEQLVRLAHDDTPLTPHLIKQVELIQMSAGVARGGLTSLSPPSHGAAGVAAFFATVRDAAVSWLRDGGWAAPDTLDGIRPHVLRREDGTGRRWFYQ